MSASGSAVTGVSCLINFMQSYAVIRNLSYDLLGVNSQFRKKVVCRLHVLTCGGGSPVASTVCFVLPRLSIPVMLNAVKHLSGAGGRRILHFVQDDNWMRIRWAGEAAMTAWGCPRLSIPVMRNKQSFGLEIGG